MWRPYHPDPAYYADRADGLVATGSLDAATARRAVAERHGCADWAALERRIASRDEEPFARAYDAIEAHDPERLAAELAAHPEIARQEGTNGNDLLGMATATNDERTVLLLLEAGADPSHPNAHGWTPLHQCGYANAVHLVGLLLDAGADPAGSARGDGGTPFVAAAFWGNRAVMELLPRAPDNLRAGAAAGDLSALGTPRAGAHRAFYRPHSGFPAWQPSDDPQEVLDEALSYAARADRAEVIGPLIAAGARPDADVYRGTALAWAAAKGATAAMRALLDHGATAGAPTSFGGEADHVTARRVAQHSGQQTAVALLREAGG